MKINESILKKIINEEVQTVISELQYERINSLIKQCVNESFDEYNETDDDTTDVEEAIDFNTFEEICSRNGWHWHDSFDVHSPEGQTGVRYVFSKGNCQFDELVKQVKENANNPDGIIAGVGQHRYAPEIKRPYIIVLFT